MRCALMTGNIITCANKWQSAACRAEEYLRSLIMGRTIHPRPCTHHEELMRKVAGLCNNANQLAHRANSTGVAGQQSVDEMTRIAKEIWHEIKIKY